MGSSDQYLSNILEKSTTQKRGREQVLTWHEDLRRFCRADPCGQTSIDWRNPLSNPYAIDTVRPPYLPSPQKRKNLFWSILRVTKKIPSLCSVYFERDQPPTAFNSQLALWTAGRPPLSRPSERIFDSSSGFVSDGYSSRKAQARVGQYRPAII